MSLIGTSAAICDLRQKAELAARSDARLLLTGERGVGKEFLARVVHQCSRRSTSPFVPVDCAALAKTHDRSFGDPGGDEGTTAALERADGGTLFLDSIGELTSQLQEALMRFLDTAEVHPPGALTSHRVDARIICSSRVPLAGPIEAGTFREDLYYRLNVVHLEIPPLRERRSDVQPLLEHFTSRHGKHGHLPPLSQEWRTAFDSYEWPENVSELKAAAARLVIEGLA